MVIEGKLHLKFDTQQVSEKFAKRDFVIEETSSPMYPQFITFQLTQDKCGLIDSFHIGEGIEVTFNLRGREWVNPKDGEVKYFNTLEAWRVAKLAQKSGPESTADIAERSPKLPNEDATWEDYDGEAPPF